MGKAATWTDTTSYRPCERGNTPPREWRWEGRGISVLIHRHIHRPPETWLMSCHRLNISARELRANDVADAQHEALASVEEELVDLETQVRKAMGE